MALVKAMYETEDLTYWPMLRSLEHNGLLPLVDRFYLYDQGRRLLLWCRDDTVMYGEYFPEKHHRWTEFTEMPELSRQQVICIVTEISFLGTVALTLDGRLLAPPRPKRPHQLLLSNVGQVVGHHCLYALTGQKQLYQLVWRFRWLAFPVEELDPSDGAVVLSCHSDQAAVLTQTGQCLVVKPIYTGRRHEAQGRFRVIHLPCLPAPPLEIQLQHDCFILARDGKVYRFSHYDRLVRPNGVSYAKPAVISLPNNEPIAHIHINVCTVFEGISGALYEYSTRWTRSTFTSYADLCAVGTLFEQTPGLVRIPPHARFEAGAFNNPTDPNRIGIVLLNHIMNPANDDQPLKAVFHANKDVILNALPFTRNLLALIPPRNLLPLAHPHGDSLQSNDTLLRYLRYLHPPYRPDGFEQRVVTLFLQTMLVLDERTQAKIAPLLARKVFRIHWLQPKKFGQFLSVNLFYNIFMHHNEGEVGQNDEVQQRIDASLTVRIIHYILRHPNRRLAWRQPELLWEPRSLQAF